MGYPKALPLRPAGFARYKSAAVLGKLTGLFQVCHNPLLVQGLERCCLQYVYLASEQLLLWPCLEPCGHFAHSLLWTPRAVDHDGSMLTGHRCTNTDEDVYYSLGTKAWKRLLLRDSTSAADRPIALITSTDWDNPSGGLALREGLHDLVLVAPSQTESRTYPTSWN